MLESLANQTAQSIDRVHLAEQARMIKLLQADEKLQNALLNSIPHNLCTPLVSITGALTTLEAPGETLPAAVRQRLIESAREGANHRLPGEDTESHHRCLGTRTGKFRRSAVSPPTPQSPAA